MNGNFLSARGPACALAFLSTALSLTAMTVPSAAAPVTYHGTIGRSEVVVELTEDPSGFKGPIGGRYFYRKRGVDIPLHHAAGAGAKLRLWEEKPCSRDCSTINLAGATWELGHSGDAATLSGTWSNGRTSLPVILRKIGVQSVGDTPMQTPLDLADATDAILRAAEPPVIVAADFPYELAKLDVPLAKHKRLDWGGVIIEYVSDPRTKFEYPRIAAMPGGASAEKANATLTQLHWRRNLQALSCAAQRYAGMRPYPSYFASEAESLGGFDEMLVDVKYAGRNLMSWVESGSTFCGGAHPDNFSRPYVMDVENGKLLKPTDLFEDWTQKGPGERLVTFVKARRPPPAGADKEREAECGVDDLISTNLDVYVEAKPGEEPKVTFGLYRLPHVINACSDDLLTVSMTEIAPLLKSGSWNIWSRAKP